MLEHVAGDYCRLYMLNRYGRKLLQLIIKDEPSAKHEAAFAQIKIIPYGIRRVQAFRDDVRVPSINLLGRQAELTYHGVGSSAQPPKIHLKSPQGYTTLINCSLPLGATLERPVPLFTLEPGWDFHKPITDAVARKCHVVSASNDQPVRFDVYLAGRQLDFEKFVKSMYFLNMLWTPDYLIKSANSPLQGGPIVAPMQFHTMGNYTLLVRRSLSRHVGRSLVQFYDNANYYEKAMCRPVAWRNEDGTMQWSTLLEEELRLTREGLLGTPLVPDVGW